MMKLKNLHTQDFRLKDDSPGDGYVGGFEAVVAHTGIVDSDNDMFLPKSVGQQSVLVGAWGHATVRLGGRPPLGYGIIQEKNDDVILEAEILDSPEGVHLMRLLGAEKSKGTRLVEWSVTVRILDSAPRTVDGSTFWAVSKAEVLEVAPVLRGAQPDTGAYSLKLDSDIIASIADAVAAALRPPAEEATIDPSPDPSPIPNPDPSPDPSPDPDVGDRLQVLQDIRRRLEK